MKLLLALGILFTGSVYGAEPTSDIDNSIEYVQNESNLYKKIYINSEDVQISDSKLLLRRSNHSLPINSLHSDARGLYLRAPIVDSYWSCVGCGWKMPDYAEKCANPRCSFSK